MALQYESACLRLYNVTALAIGGVVLGQAGRTLRIFVLVDQQDVVQEKEDVVANP